LGTGSGNVFINNKVNIRETGPIIGGRKKGEVHLDPCCSYKQQRLPES